MLERSPLHMTMSANTDATLKHCVTVKVRPAFPSEESITLTMAVAPRLPSTTPPPNKDDIARNRLLQGLQLADGDFGGQVDVIIGTLDYPLCLNPVPTKFCAVSTIFGWTVSGPLPSPSNITALKIELKEDDLNVALRQLWELEKIPKVTRLSPEDESAIKQFKQHLSVSPDGRYVVRLPRDNSTTTKVRPVFDASAKSSSGVSLNDQLLAGPNLYPFISDI